ncbi:MAG TPA: Crp/Fnr family transcriptional regulator [Chitinophagaceae bacterium]
MNTPLVQFLSNSPFLPPALINTIASEFEFKEWEKGELFLKEGKISNEYLFLENGFIRSFVFDIEGNEITLDFFTNNELVFEVSSFFQRIPSQENFETLTPCKGWVLTYEKLNNLFHTLPAFREFGRSVLVKGFSSFKLRTLSLINKTAEERYSMLIKARPEIFQQVPLKYIASYLGVTDSSLSRIRKIFGKK